MNAMTISSVHRICTGCERLSIAAAVWSVAGRLSIHDIRGNRKDGLSVEGVPIRGVFPQLRHEGAHQPGGKLINPVVVVAKLGKLTLGLIVGHKPGFVSYHS